MTVQTAVQTAPEHADTVAPFTPTTWGQAQFCADLWTAGITPAADHWHQFERICAELEYGVTAGTQTGSDTVTAWNAMESIAQDLVIAAALAAKRQKAHA